MVNTSMGQFRVRRAALVVSTAVLALAIAVPAGSAAAAQTKRISVSSGGAQAKGASGEAAVSYSGRFVAFYSSASNLVEGDTNDVDDCFLRDQTDRKTYRVSLSNSEAEANGDCDGPAVSSSGRFVAFESLASNLIVGSDTNGKFDVFVRDRVAGTTERVSVSTGGAQGNGTSRDPAISGDGRFIVFDSQASNLVNGDTNGRWDVFIHDRDTGTTSRVSVRSSGTQGNKDSRDPDISRNGRYVVFESEATNLVSTDTNFRWDVFLHDRGTAKTSRESKRSNGKQAKGGHSLNPVVSDSGRHVAYDSSAPNLINNDSNGKVDVFVRDRTAKKTKRVSVKSNGGQARGGSQDPAISGNGVRIAFTSTAKNLVAGDTNGKPDVFMRIRKTGKTKRISVKSNGGQARKGYSRDPAISGNGRFVSFESKATNLAFKDTNGRQDVFRRGAL
jgi:Tol biopolymer transport system component